MILNVIHDRARRSGNPLKPDRYELIIKEAEEVNIKLWDAVKTFPKAKTNINQAHRNIVQYAMSKGLEQVAIGEDDLHFTAPGAWNYFISHKPADFDLYLAGISWGHIKNDGTVNAFSGMFCYIVHQRFYHRFLSVKTSHDIDRAMKGLGKFVVCNPFAAITHKTISGHRKTMEKPEKYYKNRALYVGS